MKKSVITVRDVSMCFHLANEQTESMKEYAIRLLQRKLRFTVFYALNNVSFQVAPGEAVALIGRNGSGKSTMLKIIAGVLYPTSGDVYVRGTIAPLIELGAGFDANLTARENVFLNGAVLGRSRAFMKERFDRIIDFAELWDFLDIPIKNFSSGMRARLGFSIATEVTTDILIVDEILAVGDERFKKKCQDRMDRLLANGTTLLLVSHSDAQIRKLCRRAIWLERGEVRMDGPAGKVCDAYRDQG